MEAWALCGPTGYGAPEAPPSSEAAVPAAGGAPLRQPAPRSRGPSQQQKVAEMCASMGVPATFRILFLPDYLDPRRRLEMTSSMWRTLRQQLPGCEVQIHVGSAPFEDDHGVEF